MISGMERDLNGGQKVEVYTSDASTPSTPKSSSESSSAASKPKEYKDGYKLEKGDTLSKIVMDKYFDGKNPGKDKLMAKVAEVAKNNGIEEKDYTKLAIGREIKFPDSAKAAPIGTATTHRLSTGHTADVTHNANGSTSIQEFGSGSGSKLLSKDVISPKTGKGTHIEYDSDGKIKDDGQYQTEVYENNSGQIVSRYTDSSGKRIYKMFDKEGNAVNTITRKDSGILGEKNTILSDDKGWMSTSHHDILTDETVTRNDNWWKRNSYPQE